MKLRFSKLPTGLGWSAWLLIAPLAGWSPAIGSAAESPANVEGYTVNFSNVSVKEFIRFIAKATGQNFVYDDKDFADFPVTVVSEEPTSAQNLITILVQVLRTQGYSLLEQGDNLLIHKSSDVAQVAQVVTGDGEREGADQSAIVTQVFRLRQTSPDALIPILQPMVSKSARIESSNQTNQIIVTDVSQNVAKIGKLLEALDAPNPLVSVVTYDTTSAFSQETLDTANKILQPLVGKAPFLMQAQPDSQQVFIVASPFLAQQAKEVLEAIEKGQLTPQNGQPFFYPAQTQSAQTLLDSLKEMGEGLKSSGLKRSDLLQAIETAQLVPSSNSLLLLADAPTQKKLEDLLKQIDAPRDPKAGPNTLLFRPTQLSVKQMESIVRDVAEGLRQAGDDADLARVLEAARPIAAQGLLFSGSSSTLEQAQELLKAIDEEGVGGSGQASVYPLKNIAPAQAKAGLSLIANSLGKEGLSDETLFRAMENVKGVSGSNALLLSGSPSVVKRIQGYLQQLDVAVPAGAVGGALTTIPLHGDGEAVLSQLRKQAASFDPALEQLVESASFLPESNALLVHGDKALVSQLQDLLLAVEGAQILVYNPKNTSVAGLQEGLRELVSQLKAADYPDSSLIKTLESARPVPATNSVLITAPQPILTQVQTLLSSIDTANPAPAADQYFLARPGNGDAESLLDKVREISNELATSGLADAGLLAALRSAALADGGTAVAFAGDKDVIASVKTLLDQFQGQLPGAPEIYEAKNIPAGFLKEDLLSFLKEMGFSGSVYRSLSKIAESATVLPDGQSLALRGEPDQVKHVLKLLAQLDKPSAANSQVTLFPIPPNVDPQQLLASIDQLAQSASGDRLLQQVLKSREYLPQSQAIAFSGPPDLVKRAEQLVTAAAGQQGTQASSLWLYTLKEVQPDAMKSSLDGVAKDLLATANATDEQVARILQNARYNESSRSFLFSGPADLLALVQKIVPSFDGTAASAVGKPQLFLYRVQTTSVEHVEEGLKSLESTLDANNPADMALDTTIKSAKPMPDGKSILFTGDPATLQRLQQQLARLDGGAEFGTSEGGSQFLIYRLQASTPTRVEADLRALAASLQKSGLEEPGLFRTISNMQVDLKSNALIFSGEKDQLDQLKPIIAVYDVAADTAADASRAVIEPVSNSAFMIYPLRYLLGNEIESTLRQMGNDLQKAKSQTSENLLHAISTMQWIQASNTLCFSGDSATLEKLRALVSNLDQPLRQVFVEVLVLETTLAESYTFGLDWAGFGQIDPNYGIGFANTLSNNTQAQGLLNQVASQGKTQPVKPPTAGASTPVPPPTVSPGNFSLAAIGNIVRHKEQTFFDLGSLVTALQTDSNTTVVINPKIIAQDNNTATIFQGRTYGFITQQAAVFSTATTSATTIDYRTVGVQLNITPIITGDTVTLEIDQVYSDIENGFTPGTTSSSSSVPVGAGAFPTNNVHLTTRAHVPDQAILCISGLVTNRTSKGTAQIPCLGGLPLIGALFTQETTTDNRDTLMIFIKPYILASIDEMRAITQANAKLLRNSTDCYGTDDVQKAFDSIGYDKVPKSRDHEVPCIIH